MKRTKPFIVVDKKYYLGHIIDIPMTVRDWKVCVDESFIIFQADTKEECEKYIAERERRLWRKHALKRFIWRLYNAI